MAQNGTNPRGTTARPLSPAVTTELMRRYDRQGPRYTSYPTAVEFQEGLDADAYADLLTAAGERASEPLSIYVHLPFCAEQCLFCACHVIITPHYEKTTPYLELLRREIDLVAERLGRRRQVSQLHLGGGTPPTTGRTTSPSSSTSCSSASNVATTPSLLSRSTPG